LRAKKKREAALKGWKTRRAKALKKKRATTKAVQNRQFNQRLYRLLLRLEEQTAGGSFGKTKWHSYSNTKSNYIDWTREIDGYPSPAEVRAEHKALFDEARGDQPRANPWSGGFLYLVSTEQDEMGQPIFETEDKGEPAIHWWSSGRDKFERTRDYVADVSADFMAGKGKNGKHYYRLKPVALFARGYNPK
jgi:hypothetical protein